jgi:alanine dehydrogenase
LRNAALRHITAEDIARALTYAELVEVLRRAFRNDITVPVRHHHTIPTPGGDATLLLMPAWTGDRTFIGCKLLTVFPDNATRGKPSVYGSYVLLSGASGEPLAVMDGRELTAWRTAAASALAATYLASAHASHLVMIGAGVLAPHLIAAHAAVRPVRQVTLWNRTRARAEMLAEKLAGRGMIVAVSDNLETALGSADLVSCATLTHEPLVRGVLLKAGAHVDLVGGFTPAMREADDATVKRASLYVDTREGAREKAGDIVDPIRRGIIKEHDVRGDLFELCRGTSPGRRSTDEITLFKSVGTALEDLAAAMLVWERLANSPSAASRLVG